MRILLDNGHGTYSKQGVVLIQPTEKVENGDKLG